MSAQKKFRPVAGCTCGACTGEGYRKIIEGRIKSAHRKAVKSGHVIELGTNGKKPKWVMRDTKGVIRDPFPAA